MISASAQVVTVSRYIICLQLIAFSFLDRWANEALHRKNTQRSLDRSYWGGVERWIQVALIHSSFVWKNLERGSLCHASAPRMNREGVPHALLTHTSCCSQRLELKCFVFWLSLKEQTHFCSGSQSPCLPGTLPALAGGTPKTASQLPNSTTQPVHTSKLKL